MESLKSNKSALLHSIVFPVIFLVIIWVVKITEVVLDTSFAFLGVFPQTVKGLAGIIFAPLIHSDFSHLSANSIPLFVLMSSLFYFYRKIAYKIFFLIYLFTGIWVWIVARDAFHIGASGLIYGLAAFLFVSGIIRRNPRLMAITLLIAFLYGGLIWGIMPDFYPEKNISWESHLMGLLAGFVLAIYYRNTGPQRKKYSWDFENEEDKNEDDDENAFWNTKEANEL